eukprot:CAMPEP_0178956888 /NCGR_PEP_ID=MMETSP0789-20121207/10553_1 /TAXON_ID=3005 /ORGANISM="Rhizosolenia setigera, Strain CCMP 1694" /LENGTH=1093 /DNA_ID=CAMNT_0020638965 /DNA_START=152 /DNA_END=3433 /DNA_ORIENTATION=-
MSLGPLVLSKGNPFTDPSALYDIYDIRSVAYDSFRLARDEVMELRQAFQKINSDKDNKGGEEKESAQIQENWSDFTYWVYESQNTETGLFGSAESIQYMRKAEMLFPSHPDYVKFCKLEYTYDESLGRNTSQCEKPLSALNMYYASEWNTTLVQEVLDEFLSERNDDGDGYTNIDIYNSFIFCIEYDIYCEELPPFFMSTVEWGRDLNNKMERIIDKWDGKAEKLNPDFQQVTELAALFKLLTTKAPYVSSFYDEGFSLEYPYTFYSRSIQSWGSPLDTSMLDTSNIYNTTNVNETNNETLEKLIKKEEERVRKSFIFNNFLDDLDEISNVKSSETVNAYYFMGSLIFDFIIEILIRDSIKALLSFTIIFVYLWFKLKSFFLALVGFTEIVLSLPIAFKIEYFSTLNPLCLFIVAAIGADDIFVFFDAYKQSAFQPQLLLLTEQQQENSSSTKNNQDFTRRMSWVYRRSGTAMAITSATTCSAFLCTLISPLANTRSFGIFAALVIFFDYVLVMSLFCTAVVIYHNHFENCGLRERRHRDDSARSQDSSTFPALARDKNSSRSPRDSSRPPSSSRRFLVSDDERETSQRDDEEEGDCNSVVNNEEVREDVILDTEPAMLTHYQQNQNNNPADEIKQKERPKIFQHIISIISNPSSRTFMFFIFICWIVLAAIYTTKLEPLQETEEALDEDHPLQKAQSILANEFPHSDLDIGSSIYFTWGLGDVDRQGVNQLLDPDYIGLPTYQKDFDFNEQCQNLMLESCQFMKEDLSLETLISRSNGFREVKCFVEEFGAFHYFGSLDDCDEVWNGQWRQGQKNVWEVPIDQINSTMSEIIELDSCYAGQEGATGILEYYGDSLGWDGKKLRYVAIEVESATLNDWVTLSEEEVRVEYDQLISVAEIFDEKMKDACGSLSIMTDMDQNFIFMNNQKIFRTSAISGSMIGIVIAFFVILISTRTFHIALFATSTILCVLVSVIGSLSMIGWALGTTESILISILAGFSVDYVVHLAHSYTEAPSRNTMERIQIAFDEMGEAVFSGMVTSVLACLPLFLCELAFFSKFGFFLCMTIVFSWLFANFFFMGLLTQANISFRSKQQ